MTDLFGTASSTPASPDSYDASSIEVLEGLEPVRRRPGMYIGGTDERALHHLAAEVIDNAMDEAVAGHADLIQVTLETNNFLTVRDNGVGFPAHILKRAFEPYVTTKVKGTGLGLAVVKKIADEHGARIDISNRVFDGAVQGAQVSLSFAVAT